MKIIVILLSFVLSPFVFADFDKAHSSIIGTWIMEPKKAQEEWSKIFALFAEELKKEHTEAELEELKKSIEAKKNEKSNLEKYITISKDRFIITENKKIVVEGSYTLYLSRDNKILLNIYSLKGDTERLMEFYTIYFEDKLLAIRKTGDFMPEWYSKLKK